MSKKPSGLSIKRDGYKYTLSWKKGETYGDGQQLIYSYVKTTPGGSSSTKKSGTIKTSLTKRVITIKSKYITSITFKVRGKANNESWSAWTSYTLKLKPPQDLKLEAEWNDENPNATVFKFSVEDKPDAPYEKIIWQTTRELNCPSDYKAESIWKDIPTHTMTGNSGTVYDTPESNLPSDIYSAARLVRVKAVGQGGETGWHYALHVYGKPNEAMLKEVKADNTTTGYFYASVRWSLQSDETQRPVDRVEIQYCIGIPTEYGSMPSNPDWNIVGSQLNTAEYVWQGYIGRQLDDDECLWIRVATFHDLRDAYSGAYLAASGELARPYGLSITPNQSTHTIQVNVTNGSQVPDSRLAILYQDPITNESAVMGIMEHGASSPVNVIVPPWTNNAGLLGVYAFTGDYETIPRADGVTVYAIRPLMTSNTTWADTPQAPNLTVVKKNSDTATLIWDWPYTEAISAEISWADHDDAWESNEQPSTYVIENMHASTWNITGLEEGKVWYFRVRLFLGEGENAIYGTYSETVALDLTSDPDRPIITLTPEIIPQGEEFTVSWETSQPQEHAEIAEVIHGYEFDYYQKIGSVGSDNSFTLTNPYWETGTQHQIAVRYSSMNRQSEYSEPVTLTIADPLTCTIAQDSLEYDTTEINPETYEGDIVTLDGGTDNVKDVTALTVSLSPVQAGTPFPSVQVALNVNRYGVKWDMVNAQMTRTLDAEGVATNLTNFRHWGSVNASYDNPFDSIYPWSGRKLCNIDIDAYRSLQSGQSIKDCVTYWEGDAGFDYNDQYGVWVYTPEFWARSYIENGYRYFEIATNALTDYLYYEESICGRYLGCDVTLTIDGTSKHCNLPTVGMPMANVSMANMHTYAKNWGATINDIYSIDRVSTLYLVEMANMNLQNSIGGGVSSLYVQTLHPSSASTGNTVTFSELTSAQLSHIIPNAIVDLGTSDGGMQIKRTYITAVSTSGTTTTVTLADSVTVDTSTFFSVHGLINIADSEIGSKSGFIGANTKANAYYRGQTFYANKFQYILGAYRQQNTGEIWIANKGESDNYDALDTSIHIDTGNALTQASGYIQTLGMADELSFAPFCTGVGGNDTNPVGDYCYVPALSTVNTCLLLGGLSAIGAYCGWYGNWDSTAGSSSWIIGSSPSLITP